ncbi:MAG: hypothetical protein OEN55_12620 [Alphaproteobacteria bacterium]|nr:hypothetical protein [Alphaproteobacteria bacterium]
MDQRISLAAGLSLALAPAAMVVGHLGERDLSWKTNHVSTFAAHAAYDDWITASMLLAAFAMLGIGTVVSSSSWPGGKVPSSLIAMALGASVAGLLLLAAFEETAEGLAALRRLGFGAIRQQSFHDAGLYIFFHGAVLAVFASGVAMLAERGVHTRILGAAVAASGPLAYAAMVISWPAMLGIAGAGVGLKQRLSFLFLWTGAVLLLGAVTRQRRSTQ